MEPLDGQPDLQFDADGKILSGKIILPSGSSQEFSGGNLIRIRQKNQDGSFTVIEGLVSGEAIGVDGQGNLKDYKINPGTSSEQEIRNSEPYAGEFVTDSTEQEKDAQGNVVATLNIWTVNRYAGGHLMQVTMTTVRHPVPSGADKTTVTTITGADPGAPIGLDANNKISTAKYRIHDASQPDASRDTLQLYQGGELYWIEQTTDQGERIRIEGPNGGAVVTDQTTGNLISYNLYFLDANGQVIPPADHP